jgi:hypothetical protein
METFGYTLVRTICNKFGVNVKPLEVALLLYFVTSNHKHCDIHANFQNGINAVQCRVLNVSDDRYLENAQHEDSFRNK